MTLRKYNGKTARLAAVVTGLGWFLLFAGVMLNTLYAVGTDGQLYYRLQLRADIPAQASIETDRLLEIDISMANYLGGDEHAIESCPFNSDELEHIRDCYRLFRLLKAAGTAVMCGALILLALGIGVMHYRGYAAGGIATLCLWIPIVGIAVWAMIDFYGLFTVFHQLLFTNDLWLMDPAKDLMIRICPESMFAAMAAIVAAVTLTFTLVAEISCRLIGRIGRRK